MQRATYSFEDYLALLAEYPELKADGAAGLRIVLDASVVESYAKKFDEAIGIIYQDQYVVMLRDLVEDASGRPFGYMRLLNKPALSGNRGVVILPLVEASGESQKVLLIRTFRHALRSSTIELPRGFGEAGLDGAASARKELREETGYEAQECRYLGTIQPDSGLMNNPAEVYVTYLSGRAARPLPESAEIIEANVVLTLAELEREIARGAITDAYTLATMMLAKAKGLLS